MFVGVRACGALTAYVPDKGPTAPLTWIIQPSNSSSMAGQVCSVNHFALAPDRPIIPMIDVTFC